MSVVFFPHLMFRNFTIHSYRMIYFSWLCCQWFLMKTKSKQTENAGGEINQQPAALQSGLQPGLSYRPWRADVFSQSLGFWKIEFSSHSRDQDWNPGLPHQSGRPTPRSKPSVFNIQNSTVSWESNHFMSNLNNIFVRSLVSELAPLPCFLLCTDLSWRKFQILVNLTNKPWVFFSLGLFNFIFA